MAFTHLYSTPLLGMVDGTSIGWPTNTFKVALLTADYVPNQDTDEFWSTPQAYEVSGSGYTAGGVTLTGCSVSGPTSGTIEFLADNVEWTGLTLNPGFAVVYHDTGTASTSPLVGWVDFGGPIYLSDENLTVQFNTGSAFNITAI